MQRTIKEIPSFAYRPNGEIPKAVVFYDIIELQVLFTKEVLG